MTQEDHALIRETARAFAREKVRPFSAEWEDEGTLPKEIFAQAAALGLMGVTIPESYGGADAGATALALALEEIAAGDASLSTALSVHNSLTAAAILRFGNDEQKKFWLPKMAAGEILGAFALTETHAGSDASAIRCRAEKRGNGWRLNGVKQFVTSGATAGVVLVFAVSDKAAGKKGLSAFLVTPTTPGYKVARVEDKLGQRASDTCQIALDDVDIPADALLGREGDGYKIALANLEGGRIGIAAQSVGIASAALEAALAYAKERETFGRKIAEHQAVSFRLADMATEIEAARLLYLNAARLRETGRPCLKEASMAKLFASEMVERVCSAAIQIHGGYGFVRDFPVERLWRDSRVCQIYEGTSDIQRLVIGRALAAE
ncbi:MAG: acyl-CoA dehydrogenase [Alphaproteobacteria bacterium]|nr:acyl-CoA dehydrogenase [Alphaproteobacteria bacterium]